MISTVALLSDFGLRDPYVAAMKAVIAARCDARILDLGHDIAPGDLFEGAVFLAAVSPFIGAGTIVVAVVDPGVGTDRAIIAAEKNGSIYLAPDNGLLSMISLGCVRSVEHDAMFLPAGSSTFHGRDRFAPVAAALAEGVAMEALGTVRESIVRFDYQLPFYRERSASGSVISIDRFGNIVTDLDATMVDLDRRPRLRLGASEVVRTARNYQEVEDEPFLIAGSRGTVEISLSNGNAAELLQTRRFDDVEIGWD